MAKNDLQLRGALRPGYERVLSGPALKFVESLHRAFAPALAELLATRHAGPPRLDFLSSTREVREAEWAVAPLPPELLDRRVEITGPVERKMIINALNSGANVFMADFEDSNSPTWDNNVQGQLNLLDANRREISFTSETGRQYRLNEKVAVLFVRPRGLHLVERHAQVDGQPVPAALWDFGLYLFHSRRAPYFYLPKLESHLEARWWNEVFLFAQRALGIPPRTIKATCLIETLPAAFEMEEILYELKDHSAGLNCGRWDYIFSYIKKRATDSAALLPDRSAVTMDRAFLRAYSRLLIKTCHKRGAHAMGGMAAQIPIKGDLAANAAALAKVRADKLREVTDGHDGTWVAHPGLVAIAREVFDQQMPGPNQIDRSLDDFHVTREEMLAPHAGTRTEAGLRHNVRVGVRYLESWLRGQGCVPIYDLMEDAATAEISRAQVWQWLHFGVELDGAPLTGARFARVVAEEMEKVRAEVGEPRFIAGRFAPARALFERLSTADAFEEFLTIPAYDALLAEEHVLSTAA